MRNAVPIRGVDPASLLRWAAFCHGALPAVDDGRREVDFQLLLDRGERLANAFDALGIPESGTVGILSENRTEYIEADVGIALGRRVLAALGRWNVAVEESGGDALADTPAGIFARLAAEAALGGLPPVPLLALLKHPLCRLGGRNRDKANGVRVSHPTR